MSLATWALVIGAMLITMALLGTLLKRLPLSPGILYLAIGYALGPAGWALMAPDPLLHSADLETMAEVALLISLFAVGLKLGVPLRDKRWYLPLRLAFPSMALTVVLVAVSRRIPARTCRWARRSCSPRFWRPPIPCSRRTCRSRIRRIAIACASA